MKIKYIGKSLLIEKKDEVILAVGDLHLGYEESLNRAGIYITRTIFKEIKEDFEKIIKNVGRRINKIILLGDVKHDFGEITKQEREETSKFFEYLKEKCDEIIIVRGNHDKIIEPLIKIKEIRLENYYIFEDICFAHGDKNYLEMSGKKIKVWILGHGHPAVKISDGTKVEKYKCFLVGKYKDKKVIIVPSFFSANEGSDPRENHLGMAWNFDYESFEAKVINENQEVLDFGKMKDLN